MININPIKEKNLLVSIVYALEGDVQLAINIFKNLREQVYKNVEYIFVYTSSFNIEEFKNKIFEVTDLDLTIPTQYIENSTVIDMVDEGIKAATGDVIFIKSTSPLTWYKHHILLHLEKHNIRKNRESIVLSNIETKNLFKGEADPMGTLGYRISKKIQPTDLILDEISFTRDLSSKIQVSKAFVEENGMMKFDVGRLFNQLQTIAKSVQFTDEISVVLFIPHREQGNEQKYILTQPDWQNLNTVQDVRDDEDLTIRHYMPEVFGNAQLDEEWNSHVRNLISTHWSDIMKESEKNVIIKRTIGMGDVIQTEPIVRFFKNLGFKVWFVTASARGCDKIIHYFDSRPDVVMEILEQEMNVDVLGSNNLKVLLTKYGHNPEQQFDLRIDLDLSYESHFPTPFVKAYFNTFGVTEMELEEFASREKDFYTPMLQNFATLDFVDKSQNNTIAVTLEGSGWDSKEINVEDAHYILKSFKDKGYRLVHTCQLNEKYSSLHDMFDEVNEDRIDESTMEVIPGNNFEVMMKMIYDSIGFIGADNGAMHIALSYEKPIFVWNGAALTEITTQHHNKDLYTVLKKDLPCLGCKHKMFFNLMPVTETQMMIRFLPNCENENQFECMSKFDNTLLDERIGEFEAKIKSNVIFDKVIVPQEVTKPKREFIGV